MDSEVFARLERVMKGIEICDKPAHLQNCKECPYVARMKCYAALISEAVDCRYDLKDMMKKLNSFFEEED